MADGGRRTRRAGRPQESPRLPGSPPERSQPESTPPEGVRQVRTRQERTEQLRRQLEQRRAGLRRQLDSGVADLRRRVDGFDRRQAWQQAKDAARRQVPEQQRAYERWLGNLGLGVGALIVLLLVLLGGGFVRALVYLLLVGLVLVAVRALALRYPREDAARPAVTWYEAVLPEPVRQRLHRLAGLPGVRRARGLLAAGAARISSAGSRAGSSGIRASSSGLRAGSARVRAGSARVRAGSARVRDARSVRRLRPVQRPRPPAGSPPLAPVTEVTEITEVIAAPADRVRRRPLRARLPRRSGEREDEQVGLDDLMNPGEGVAASSAGRRLRPVPDQGPEPADRQEEPPGPPDEPEPGAAVRLSPPAAPGGPAARLRARRRKNASAP